MLVVHIFAWFFASGFSLSKKPDQSNGFLFFFGVWVNPSFKRQFWRVRYLTEVYWRSWSQSTVGIFTPSQLAIILWRRQWRGGCGEIWGFRFVFFSDVGMVIQSAGLFSQYGSLVKRDPSQLPDYIWGQFLGELLLVKFGVGRKNMH